MTLEKLKQKEKDLVTIRDNDWLEGFANACYQAAITRAAEIASDWARLCCKCHRRYDRGIKNKIELCV